jgi:WD40 repeat protein
MDPHDLSRKSDPSPPSPGTSHAFRAPTISIPDHDLIRCIGSGSYGTVWLAKNMMGAYRAVKIVYRNSFKDQRPFERELSGIRKFEPLSRSHEGFIDVLHVGINDPGGYFYYVMELGDDSVTGQLINPDAYTPKTLSSQISAHGKLPLQDSMQLGLALSHALAELHRHDLVHRDIKPSNIIFVNGVPKLADIGLVADINEARSYVGTEGFIPPEGPGTPQADVYSLGKVLYEASTGRDRQDFPELPTNWDQSDDHLGLLELNEVILQACKNDPARRYASAWDMHADLLVLANGKSVKRLKILERRLANLKRSASISALVLFILAAIGYHFYRERAFEREARQRQVGAKLAYGNRAVDEADPSGALPYFADALDLDQGRPLESLHRIRLGSVIAQCPRLVQLLSGQGEVENVAFSPRGQYLAISEHFGRTRIFDAQSGAPLSLQFTNASYLWYSTFSRDEQYLLTSSEDKLATVWRLADGSSFSLLHPDKVFSAGFNPDHSLIVTACRDKIGRIWNFQNRVCERTLEGHTGQLTFSAFSPDGSVIVTCARDNTVRLWTAQGKPIGSPLVHARWVYSAGFSPDGKTLVTACGDHRAHVWDLSVSPPREQFPSLFHDDHVFSAEFSPDGRLIVTAGLDGTARIWLADQHQLLNPSGNIRHHDRILCASFHPDGHRIATCCFDGTVCIWDLAGTAMLPRRIGSLWSQDASRYCVLSTNQVQVFDSTSNSPVSSPINASSPFISLNRNGKFLIALTPQRINSNHTDIHVQLTDVAANSTVTFPFQHPLGQAALSGDGQTLFAYGSNIASFVRGPFNRTPLAPIALTFSANIAGAAFSPDDKFLAIWTGQKVHILNCQTGSNQLAPLTFSFYVTFVAFNPDASSVVVSGNEGTGSFMNYPAEIWRLNPPQLLTYLRHRDAITFASFNSDGSRIVTASEDFKAIIWDAATGRPIAPALSHHQQVSSAVFSPDDRFVLTASRDKTARLWDANTGEPLTPPFRHHYPLAFGRFLAHGDQFVTSDGSGYRVWSLPQDGESVSDTLALAHFLGGTGVHGSTPGTGQNSEPLSARFATLRSRNPSLFTVSQAEIIAWHDFQTADAEASLLWTTAAFHLNQLVRLEPKNKYWASRLQNVESKLKPGS